LEIVIKGGHLLEGGVFASVYGFISRPTSLFVTRSTEKQGGLVQNLVSMTNSHDEKLIFCMLFNRLYIQDLMYMKLPPTKCFSKYLLYKTAVFQFDYATCTVHFKMRDMVPFTNLVTFYTTTSDKGDLSHQVEEPGSPDSAAIGSASPIRDEIHTKLSL